LKKSKSTKSNSTQGNDKSNNNYNPSQKNGKRNGKVKFKKGKKNGQGNHTSSFLDGQAKPICSFCGNIGHVENTCRAKERAMKEAKQSNKDKSQKMEERQALKSSIICNCNRKSSNCQ
jgi:hypothetical protein